MPIGDKKYVILSVSEIAHDPSEYYMHCQFFGGILHFCYSALNADARDDTKTQAATIFVVFLNTVFIRENCGVILNDKPQFFNSVFNQPFIRSA